VRDTEGVVRRSVGKRRRFSEEYRREVVQETLAPGASVAGVALKHRLNANLVFTWRRKLLPALAPAQSVELLPVTVSGSAAALPAVGSEPAAAARARRRLRLRGAIEIELNGARIVVRGAVDAQALRVVLAVLASR